MFCRMACFGIVFVVMQMVLLCQNHKINWFVETKIKKIELWAK